MWGFLPHWLTQTLLQGGPSGAGPLSGHLVQAELVQYAPVHTELPLGLKHPHSHLSSFASNQSPDPKSIAITCGWKGHTRILKKMFFFWSNKTSSKYWERLITVGYVVANKSRKLSTVSDVVLTENNMIEWQNSTRAPLFIRGTPPRLLKLSHTPYMVQHTLTLGRDTQCTRQGPWINLGKAQVPNSVNILL